MEKFLCSMIVSGAIPDAKIHRPLRIVNLRARKANVEELDQWASSVRKLTDILNKVHSYVVVLMFTIEGEEGGGGGGRRGRTISIAG